MESTNFAALLAAVGIAIGAAWSGLLRGCVKDVGLFGTTVNTLDNVLPIVGNGKVSSETIQNFSANPFRRVDLVAQLAHEADHYKAAQLLKTRLQKIPNVLANPTPDLEILQFTLAGPVLAVRPCCRPADYWQVYFDANRLIQEGLQHGGFPFPEQHDAVRGHAFG